MMPSSRSSIRLGCIAALLLAGMVSLLNPAVADKGAAVTVNTQAIEKRGADQIHHHHVENHQHQAHWIQSDHGKKQAGHHHHVPAAKKKVKAIPQALNLHMRHRTHQRKQVHCKKKTHKRPINHKKPIEHKDKECGKRGDASVSILVCNNQTISAVYCPHGKLPHPDAWARSLVKRDLFTALNHGKHRHHSHAHKPHHDHHDHPDCRPSKSPEVAHTDVIPMHKPCPKSDRKDIADTFKQLTCPDQATLSPLLWLGVFSEAAINAVDRHNTDGDCKAEHHWQDKCTDVGTFCGIDLFGCNTIDDGLYYCDAIGNDPQLLEVCDVGACVSRKDRSGPAHCGDDTCTCAKTGYICGSSFPKTCRLDENSLYFCTAGSKPVLHQKCTGSSCPADSNACSKDPVDTQCLCQAPGTICGSAFPKKCGLTPGALYVCPDNGEPPKFLEDNSEECTTDVDECLCTNAGDYCGSSFPVSCGLKSSALYTCSAEGERPMFKQDCPSGQCPANAHECGAVEKCVCSEKGDICGSTFPPECNLRADVVYTCIEIGDAPIYKKGCLSGVCPPNADDCEEELKCVCPGAGDFCGSNFAEDCDLKPNSIYSCAGKGERPVFKEECPSGECRRSTNKCIPARNCLCKEKGTICGATFNDSCALIHNALYECSDAGVPPILLRLCPSRVCESGQKECGELGPCVCKASGQICGASFDATCNLNATSLYYCREAGSTPSEIESCASKSCPADATACDPDPCLCKSSGQICGSSFLGQCGYNSTTLYFCKSEGSKPEFVRVCESNICPQDATNCGVNPAPDLCLCKNGKEQICGSSFDASCNLDPDTIYYCSKTGDSPVAIEKCKVGTCTGNGHNCERPFTCRCKGKGTPCGSEFPAECMLDPDTKYQCGEAGDRPLPIAKFPPGMCTDDPFKNDPCKCFNNGTICGSLFVTNGCTRIPIIATSIYQCIDNRDPTEVAQCLPPKVCTQTSEGATCNDTPCTCSSEGAKICGAAADPTCGLNPTSTYICTGGSFVLNNTCTTACDFTEGECFDKCECPASGFVCGSTFPGCGLNDQSLYSCVKGRKPVLLRECKPGQCISGPAPTITFAYPGPVSGQYQDTCGPNPCYCDPGEQLVCDSMFPEDCKLQKGSILSCPGTGGKPIPVETCDPAVCMNINGTAQCQPSPCNCIDAGSYCGSSFPEVCHFPPNAVYSCLEAGAKPIIAASCDPQQCIPNDKNAECAKDPCKCSTTNATVCASSFPTSCRLKPDVVYSCTTAGEYPVEVAVCTPEKCIVVADVGQCDKDPCLCNSAIDRLCGSVFPEKCGYVATAIYRCPAALVKPILIEECPPGLVCANEQNGPTCHSDLCHCHSSDIGKNICGNTLFDGCEYDDNVIYTCNADGAEWEPVRTCSPGECIAVDGVPKCSRDDCICKPDSDGKEYCDTNFPSVCGLVADSVYVCSAGQPPVLKEFCPPNKCEHNALAGTAICKNPLCNCPAGAITACSEDFPATCNYDPNSVYTCSDPKNPAKLEDCNPVTCLSTPPTARCNADPCACRAGDTTVCGSSFPLTCMLKPEGIYQCVGNKYPQLISECTPTACYISNGTAFCERDDCVCKDGQQTACYFDFPATCGFTQDPQQVFKCEGPGSKPALDVKCSTECIVDVPDVSSKCKPDICACAPYMAGKQVCASQFPSECGYLSDKLYYCPAQDVRPTVVQECALPSQCVVDRDTGSCVTPVDPCKCPAGKEQICGSSFNSTCGWIDSALYDCKDRAGQDPILIKNCAPQTCIPSDTTDYCSPDPCLCKEVLPGSYCGSTLPAECNFDPNTLYACTEAGARPVEVVKCEFGTCDPSTSSCVIDPCSCGTNKPTCGSDFDATCGLDPNGLYNCPGVGETPVLNTTCTAGCVKGSGQCTPDPCKCTKTELKCGSAFDPSCMLNKDTLYECKKAGDDPLVKQQCIAGGCVAGTTACQPDPCKCGTAATTCGKDYLLRCGFTPDTIYTCSGQGATPQPSTTCGSGLCASVNGTAICKPDCTCKTNLDTCGVDFPAECGLNVDTLYTCNNIGDKPVAKEVCKPGACRTGTHQCYVDPCACKSVGQLCGKDICSILGADTVYICNNEGATPIPSTVCPVGKCNGGKCAPPEDCLCTQNGPFCGGELPCPGLNPELYYSCSIGKKPFPFGYCRNGKPTDGNCLCNDGYGMCSTYFPFECGYDQNQVMACPGGRDTKPVTVAQCGVGRCTNQIKCDTSCKCKSTADVCGKEFDPACNYEQGSTYKCSAVGAIPVLNKKCGLADLCIPNYSGARCVGECQCKDVDTVCGAAFPSLCGFQAAKLYRCDYAGARPESPKSCAVPCNPQNGPDRCGMTEFTGR